MTGHIDSTRVLGDDDVLYHYTSAAGLIGLLGTPTTRATMWLSQIQYMNDHAEFYHAFELVRQVVLTLEQELPELPALLLGLWGVPHGPSENLAPVKGTVMHRLHSFSLSRQPDLLSQWRGYAPNGGYCIGYNVRDLRTLSQRHQFNLLPCVYNENEKKVCIAEALREIHAALIRQDVGPQLFGLVPRDEAARRHAKTQIQQLAHEKSSNYKHQTFQEEEEWRIIGTVTTDNPQARWRTRGNLIIPYCELDISEDSPPPLRPIEIIIGPGVDFDLADYAIKSMLKNSDAVSVRPSSCTLRM